MYRKYWTTLFLFLTRKSSKRGNFEKEIVKGGISKLIICQIDNADVDV